MKIRHAFLEDLTNGLLDLWQVLGDVSKLKTYEADQYLMSSTGIVFVGEEDREIVATANLIIDQKVIRNGGRAARIEEVVVKEEKRGCGYGREMVEYLVEEAKRRRCYKITLVCNDANVGFYEKCGMKKQDNTMRIDLK